MKVTFNIKPSSDNSEFPLKMPVHHTEYNHILQSPKPKSPNSAVNKVKLPLLLIQQEQNQANEATK